MHLCNTKDNHFVPQFYLKSFLDISNNIYLGDKKNNKCYRTKDLKSIAFKTNLYTITEKISNNDIEWFRKTLKLSVDNSMAQTYLSTLVCFLNDELANLFSIKTSNKECQEILDREIKSLINEEISRNQELLFSLYENDFYKIYIDILEQKHINLPLQPAEGPFLYLALKITQFIYSLLAKKAHLSVAEELKEIKQDDQEILEDLIKLKEMKIEPNGYYDLWHYILIQYFRTEKIIGFWGLPEETRKRLNTIEKANGVNSENVMFLIIHYQTLNLLEKLIQDDFKLILIKNETEMNFITSDNPAVNPYSSIAGKRALQDGEFEIYFPLSPKLAILCSKNFLHKNYDKDLSEVKLTSMDEVDYWNKLILHDANRYIYTTSENIVKKYITPI